MFLLFYLNGAKLFRTKAKGMVNDIILIDFMKAFDAIDNDVLLQESCAIGFSKCTVNWFESYISIRSLSVNLGSNFSQLRSLS